MKISKLLKVTGTALFIMILGSFSLKAQSFIDIDGNENKTIKYGMQEWTSVNLNVTHFRNGDEIPEAKTPEEWISAGSSGSPAWCYFDNIPENAIKYGKLYNWFAINDPRGLTPEGWHIPVNADWKILVKNLLGVDYAGPKLKSVTGWKSKNGSNKIGFSAVPAGFRDKDGVFREFNTKSQWWSNSEPVEVKKSNQIYSFVLNDQNESVVYIKMNKESGLSVRIIKD